MRALWAILGLLLVALTACGSVPDSTQLDTAVPPAASAPAAAGEVLDPQGLNIPALSVTALLAQTGLKPDNTIAEPDVNTPEVAAWVNVGPAPGEVGRAVIIGHVNGAGRPGVFAELGLIKSGDEIVIGDKSGANRTFIVDEVTQWSKDSFPRGRVYGDTDRAELALVTCGGEFDSATGHYRDNIVVFSHAA